MVEEVWKWIPEHLDYDVSNLGEVISWKRGNNFTVLKKFTNPSTDSVSLDKEIIKVHDLVARAFVPNPYNLPYVRHKDGNGHNNRADNLYWSDESEVRYIMSEEGLESLRLAQAKRRGTKNKKRRKKKDDSI